MFMTTFHSIQTRRNVIREDLKLCKERRERRHLQNDRNIYIYTSASYSRSEPAPPPLECTLQQANVSLPKGMPLNWGAWEEIQWHALRQVTFACCSVHSNGGGAGSDRL